MADGKASSSAPSRPVIRRLCPPQLNYLEFLAQASTESQGPWDSNYQVEDDYSWFRPGKHGDHDMKFGFRYNYTTLRRVSQVNQNGTFTFNTNLPFNPANPRTYPERFSIRTGPFEENVKNHTYEAFAQDKWHITPRTTINLGVRYDLEIIPLDETGNPLFSPGQAAPTDKNNISPRVSFTHSLDADGKSVIRGGYGIFYNRTILGAIDDTLEFGKFTSSNVVTFPASGNADPGPTAGRLPTEPYLVNGPYVNRALLDAAYPPGVSVRNNGVVIFDSPNRTLPYAHQFTLGYERELRPSLALHVDYVRAMNKDMFLARNLNPALRVDTSRTGALTRSDAFGVLGQPYTQQVWVMENTGDADYNALDVSLEKRYSNKWSGRISYSLSKSIGTGQRSGRQEPVSGDDEPQPRFVARPEQRGSPAHPVVGSPDGDSEDRRGDTIRHRALHERRAVHDFRQQHRRRSQRRARRSRAGRHLQRPIVESGRHAERDVRRRPQRCLRPRLFPAGSAGRLAAED